MLADDVARAASAAQREHWGRVLAGTLRLARDLDIAEEATAEAFLLALETWPARGVPDSVEAWLLTTARRRAIDRLRRAARLRDRLAVVAAAGPGAGAAADADLDAPAVDDDELRLVVLCCHPALAVEAQIALTLRLGCGAPTPAVASAFLVSESTMAARITRAKHRVAASGVPVELPDDATVDDRLPAVRRAVHLAYTMGHTAGSGTALRDDELAGRAVRLARSLHRLRSSDAETASLLAVVVLSEARAAGRIGVDGSQVLLADADRSRSGSRARRRGPRPRRRLVPSARPVRRPGRDRGRARPRGGRRDDRLGPDRRALRPAADAGAEPDRRTRPMRRHRATAWRGGRTVRPRRRDRRRQPRLVPVRPRPAGAAARPSRPRARIPASVDPRRFVRTHGGRADVLPRSVRSGVLSAMFVAPAPLPLVAADALGQRGHVGSVR